MNFLQHNVSILNFNSLHFYSDLGYPKDCKKMNGSYAAFVLHITNLPLGFPGSICLPKECDKEEYFIPLMHHVNERIEVYLD